MSETGDIKTLAAGDRETMMGLRLCEHVCEQGTHRDDARKYLNVSGIRVYYDRIWFTGSFDIEKHRVGGSDWDIEISFYKGTLDPRDLEVRSRRIMFRKESKLLTGAVIDNYEGFKRDLALLRMFGLENLFSQGDG